MQPTSTPQPSRLSEALGQLSVLGIVLLIALVSQFFETKSKPEATAKSIRLGFHCAEPLQAASPAAPRQPSVTPPIQPTLLGGVDYDYRSKLLIPEEYFDSPKEAFEPFTKVAIASAGVAKGKSGAVQDIAAVRKPAPATSYAPSTSSLNRYYDPTYRPLVGDHYVSGYTKKDGTVVSGYYRTNRDDSFWNNYSSKGNVNPYTGKLGTKLPPLSSPRSYSSSSFGGKR